jgi:hypothetical protein
LYEQTAFFGLYIGIRTIFGPAGYCRRARILQEGAHTACHLLFILLIFHDVFNLGSDDFVGVLLAGAASSDGRLCVRLFGGERVWGSGFSGRRLLVVGGSHGSLGAC